VRRQDPAGGSGEEWEGLWGVALVGSNKVRCVSFKGNEVRLVGVCGCEKGDW